MGEPPPSFTCPRCGAVSYNPNDIAAGYCGRCHAYTAPPPGIERCPSDGDPLAQQWYYGGHPLHRSVEGHPMTMYEWVEAQNDPTIRIRRQTFFEDGSYVVTIWTGLWDPLTYGGGGFDVIHRYGSNELSHVRRSDDHAAEEAHQTLVDRLLRDGHIIKENP